MDQTSDRPPYRQIADQLRAAITAGEHPPGAKLPSARKLAREYQVDRLTVTRAMELLEAEGLVIAQQGRGVFVRTAQPRQRLLRDRIAHRDERGYYFDLTARSWVAVTPPTISTGVAPDDVAALLELPPGSQVLIRDRRIGEAGGSPLQLATSYLPLELARGTRLAQPDTGPGGIYDRMEEMGHILQWTEIVAARMPTPDEAAILGVPPGVPLLRILRTTLNQEHRPLEVNDTRMAADRFELGYAIQRADVSTS